MGRRIDIKPELSMNFGSLEVIPFQENEIVVGSKAARLRPDSLLPLRVVGGNVVASATPPGAK